MIDQMKKLGKEAAATVHIDPTENMILSSEGQGLVEKPKRHQLVEAGFVDIEPGPKLVEGIIRRSTRPSFPTPVGTVIENSVVVASGACAKAYDAQAYVPEGPDALLCFKTDPIGGWDRKDDKWAYVFPYRPVVFRRL